MITLRAIRKRDKTVSDLLSMIKDLRGGGVWAKMGLIAKTDRHIKTIKVNESRHLSTKLRRLESQLRVLELTIKALSKIGEDEKRYYVKQIKLQSEIKVTKEELQKVSKQKYELSLRDKILIAMVEHNGYEQYVSTEQIYNTLGFSKHDRKQTSKVRSILNGKDLFTIFERSFTHRGQYKLIAC